MINRIPPHSWLPKRSIALFLVISLSGWAGVVQRADAQPPGPGVVRVTAVRAVPTDEGDPRSLAVARVRSVTALPTETSAEKIDSISEGNTSALECAPAGGELPAGPGISAWCGEFDRGVFTPDPGGAASGYDPHAELGVYAGKWCVPVQRPLIELWRGLYLPGEIPPGIDVLGEKNLILPHFLLYGDYRTGAAYIDPGTDEDEFGVIAHRLNLDFDLQLTATERFHAFWGPLDENGQFTRLFMDEDRVEFIEQFDDDFDTAFFEGDLGYIWGGMTDQDAPFDFPFVVGKYPLLFQNGIWLVDAFEGFACTIPARNSPLLRWSNWELTLFAAYDDADSPAFRNNDNAADVYGVNSFIEAYEGYFEVGYAYLQDQTGQGLSYNNVGFAFTRRYLQRVSNSVRVIVNTGQDPVAGAQTADGMVLLVENALVSDNPNFFVPYCNIFAGFDTPQSVARAAGTGGILINTGINFESDGLTAYPTLDATANNTYGGAVGFNLLGPDFRWQYILELATVQTFGTANGRIAKGDEYAAGTRIQIPLNNAWLVRFDTMFGLREKAADIGGARMELRWKF